MKTEHKLFVCECTNTSHQVVVTKFSWDDGIEPHPDDPDLCFTVYANKYLPWYKRFVKAFKFAFGFDEGDFYDTVLFNRENTTELRDLLNDFLKDLHK